MGIEIGTFQLLLGWYSIRQKIAIFGVQVLNKVTHTLKASYIFKGTHVYKVS